MANIVAQSVNGQTPLSVYAGDAALLPWLLIHGYVYDDTSTTSKINDTDTTPANDPMLEVNREEPGDVYQFGLDAALAARVFNVIDYPGPNAGPHKYNLPAAGGTTVCIKGDNFTGATSVTFGGTAGTNFVVVNAQTIVVTTPAKAAGTYDVVVVKGAGNGTLTAGVTYI